MSERPPEVPPGEPAPPPTAPPTAAVPPPAAATATEAPRPIDPPPGATIPPPAAAPGAAVPPGAVRRLTRRTDNRVIAGVASGIAAFLGIEPWIVRIGFVVLVPFGGFGALAYLIAWLLVPVEGTGRSLASAVVRRPPSGWRSYVGVALILLAVAILASAFSEPGVIWAIVLIAFGVFLFRQDDPEPPDRRPPTGGGPGPGSAVATAPLPPAPPVSTTTTTAPLAPPAPDQDPTTPTADLPVWPPPPPPPAPAAAWGPPPPRRPRRRPFLGPLTFAVALIVTGLALALDNLDVVDLTFGQVLAVFLTVLGGGLLVGTWWGRAWGLIPVGLLAVPVVAIAALAGSVPVEGDVAERLFQPRTAAEVRPSYRLTGGELILDLSDVDFGPGAPPVQASVAGGRLLVVLPDEVAADIRGRVGVGSLDLLGEVDSGAQVDSTVTRPAATRPAEGDAPTVRLDLQTGFGVIEVRRASDPRPFQEAGPFEDSFPERPERPARPTAPESP
ncbi:MAG TPA: PspC domain-containing protein [Actinomycetota bacterium]|nr:PspC domain-containing protein [Actinomycetota bacterium]